MLYLIGGASRAGKSTLARRLLTEHGIPYFAIDFLMMGLARGVPAFGMNPDASNAERGEKLWPLVRAMAANILDEERMHPHYLLEGDALLPRYVTQLRDEHMGHVRACFIGYCDADPAQKLREVRAVEPDWFSYDTDDAARAFLAEMVAFSRTLRAECAAYGLPYIDASEGIAPALDAAVALCSL